MEEGQEPVKRSSSLCPGQCRTLEVGGAVGVDNSGKQLTVKGRSEDMRKSQH